MVNRNTDIFNFVRITLFLVTHAIRADRSDTLFPTNLRKENLFSTWQRSLAGVRSRRRKTWIVKLVVLLRRAARRGLASDDVEWTITTTRSSVALGLCETGIVCTGLRETYRCRPRNNRSFVSIFAELLDDRLRIRGYVCFVCRSGEMFGAKNERSDSEKRRRLRVEDLYLPTHNGTSEGRGWT